MKRYYILMILSVAFLATGMSAPAAHSMNSGHLKPSFVDVDSKTKVRKLARMGLDITAVRSLNGGTSEKGSKFRVELMVSERDSQKLERAGFFWQEIRQERSASTQFALGPEKAAGSVFHSFDESRLGIKDQLHHIADTFPDIARLKTIGYSIQNRPLLALCLTQKGKKNKRAHARHRKPQVLIVSTLHAREWIATEMAMRLCHYLTRNYGSDARVTSLLNNTKIWIIPVANPDGYEYTFTHERMWRKNLRDNDGDGDITWDDGVDLNRNFAFQWGLNDEGSSPVMSDSTYRGTAPNSEPETQALMEFINQHRFKSLISYHSYGDLIYYPWGWQVKTPSFDDPIFVAQAGTDESPAIFDTLMGFGYDPGLGTEWYTSNGELADWVYGQAGILSYTVELTYGYHDPDDDNSYYGFEFPDDEGMVQQVFDDNLEFALTLFENAQRPAHTKSLSGETTKAVYHDPISVSYGDRQIIEVLARTDRRPPKLYYQINGGPWRLKRFRKMLGTFYNEKPGLYYCGYKTHLRRQQTGDQVRYFIRYGKNNVGPYTYAVESASKNKILVVSAEDYTGENPTYEDSSGPNFLHYYTDALDAGGYSHDVWDVSARAAVPNYPQVLSNYDVVVWYTGDDIGPTLPKDEVSEDTVLSMRKFLNFGGKIFASGQGLSHLADVEEMFNDDFFQYRMGAFMHLEGAGMDTAANPVQPIPFGVVGEPGDPIFGGMHLTILAGDGGNNQTSPDSFLATSHFHPAFQSRVAARYHRPVGPFDPYSGDYYVYSQMADEAYKRLGGIFDLPADATSLNFRISYDTQTDYDYAFVEIREVGTDDWTTLPDTGGLTTRATGGGCEWGWVDDYHPHLAHYMNENCEPFGTTGQWHGFTGNSNGWQPVHMDLSAYAGKKVELYIAYASDMAWDLHNNLGVFIDDITLDGSPLEDFEIELGDWQATSTPDSTPRNNWIRIAGADFPEGPVIRTDQTVYMGFGFEAINTSTDRADVMDRVMTYLSR